MKITITDHDTRTHLRPEEAWGTEGRVFQIYAEGKPQNTYIIGVARSEDCWVLWFNEESQEWATGTQSKESLKGYLPHVTIVEVEAEVEITLRLK